MKICTSLPTAKNIPFDSYGPKKKPSKNIFFSEAISISELQELADIPVIPEENDQVLEMQSWERSQKCFERWSAKSSSGSSSDPKKFHLALKSNKKVKIITPENIQLTPPPPGFSDRSELKVPSPEKKKRWVDFSSDSDLSGTPIGNTLRPLSIPIQKVDVILKPPPLKPSLLKREQRSKFTNETVTEMFFVGKVKFYNLKKRHGFILVEGADDVFLPEDELVLSGIVLRKFKDDIYNKKEKVLRFRIKTRCDNGKINRIATNIEQLT